MIESILASIGLRPNEIQIYLALLQSGTTYVSRLVQEVPIPKATIYDILESLEKRWLVHSYIHAKTTKYTAENPEILEHILSKEAKNIKIKQNQLATILPELYGMQDKYFGVPKIRMYQGEEGMRTVLDDTLTTRETIDTIVNVSDMEQYFHDTNNIYAYKRIEKNIKKRVLVEDTQWCRDFLATYSAMSVSEVRFLPRDFKNFHLEMNLYDGKVNYITYRHNQPVGVIVEDVSIYELQKALFASLWNK